MIFGKYINRYYLKNAPVLLLGLLALLMVDYIQLLIPQFYRLVINGVNLGQVVVNGQTLPFTKEVLLQYICLPMIWIVVLMVIGRFLWRICFFGSAVRVAANLRERMFDHSRQLSQQYYQVNKVGNLMSLYTNDIDTIQECFGDGILMFFDALVLGLMALYKMWRMDYKLTLLALIPALIMFGIGTVMGTAMTKRWEERQQAFSDLSDFAQENFSGIAVIKAFVKELKELMAFRKLNKQNEEINVIYTKIATINGTIYAVPANKGMALNGNLIWDDDIAQAAGVDMSTVNSIEDLEAVFEQVHAYDPNIVCYAPNNQGDTSLIRPILRSEEKIDCLNDTDYYAGVSMNGDSTVTNLYASDAFMEKCKLMREWNQKGYLQADAATTTSTAPELFSAGRCFSTIDAYGGDSAGAVLSLSSGHNLKSKILYNFYFDSASVYVDFGIASTSKVPEAAMKMINRLWTDEYLINTFLYGEEGVDYVKPDADHWAYPDGKDATTVGYTAALCTGVIGSESLQYQPVGTDIADIQLKLKHNKESERSPFFGFMFDASGVTTEMSAIANVYNQYVPGLICGTVDPETTMPEFLNALDAAGINTVIQAKQEQLDAWIAAQK